MPSEFDTFAAEFAAPALAQQFGWRDEQGAMAVIVCREPGDVEPLELLGVSIGRLRITDEIPDEHGTHVRDQVEDVVDLYIPRKQIKLSTLYTAKTESRFDLPPHPGESFTLLEVIDETHSLSVVRCSRKHIVRIHSSRSERE